MVVTAFMLNESVLGLENNYKVMAALNPVDKLKLKLGLENDCIVEAALNPVNERKLKLDLENVCIVEAALNPANERKLKLVWENDCIVEVALNPANENSLKLKQDGLEQGRVLEGFVIAWEPMPDEAGRFPCWKIKGAPRQL